MCIFINGIKLHKKILQLYLQMLISWSPSIQEIRYVYKNDVNNNIPNMKHTNNFNVKNNMK